jgi:hypothetical protein
VFAATYELVTLDRKTQVISGATNGTNACADRAGDIGDERPGAGVDPRELGQAARRGAHPDHGDQEDQRRRRAGQGDHDAGREEQVERRGHLGQPRHDHTEQPELAALQGLGLATLQGLRGVGHR